MSPLLLGLSLTPMGSGLVVAVVVAALLLGILVFKKDTEIENRRRAANEVASILREKGLRIIPDILSDYAVGDYSGMVAKFKHAAKLLLNPEMAAAEFEGVFQRILEEKLKNPDQRAALIEKVTKMAAAYKPAA